MKSLLIIISLCIFTFIGCATSKPAFHSRVKDEVYLDIFYAWSNDPVKCFPQHIGQPCSPTRAITLRLINKRYRDVNVEVSCHFKSDKLLFGKKTVTVKKRDDKIFMVYGFARGYDSETVTCGITNIQ